MVLTKQAIGSLTEGIIILNPKELPLAHQYFSPSPEEIARVNEMLQLSAEAQRDEECVAVKDNKFIGPPMVKMEKKMIKKQALIIDKEHLNSKKDFGAMF